MFEEKILNTMKPVIEAQDKTNKILFGIGIAGVALGLGGCTTVSRIGDVESELKDLRSGLSMANRAIKKVDKTIAKRLGKLEKNIGAVDKKAAKALKTARISKNATDTISLNLNGRPTNNFTGGMVSMPAVNTVPVSARMFDDEFDDPFPTEDDFDDEDLDFNLGLEPQTGYVEDDEEDEDDEEIVMNPLSE